MFELADDDDASATPKIDAVVTFAVGICHVTLVTVCIVNALVDDDDIASRQP